MKFKPIWILHTLVIVACAYLFFRQHAELNRKYDIAIEYAQAGDYENAHLVMSSIAEYRDAPSKTADYNLELKYQEGIKLISEGDFDNALVCFDVILVERDYKDTKEQKNLCLYEQGVKYAYEGDLTSAERKFLSLPQDFKDVAARKQVITDNRKFKGSWKCVTNDLDLKTTVYIDYDNTPKIRAELSDHDALLLDEPITLNGDDLEIHTDRFSWAIYGSDSYSFVYGKDAYTVMKQPVTEGTVKYEFARVKETDYDKLNAQYTTTEF